MVVLCLFYWVIAFSQGDFIIHGKIDRHSTSKSVTLASSWGTFTSEIQNDGSFQVTGSGIKQAGDALIYTDSSNANSIWLEPGEYYIECKEIKLSVSSRPILRIPKLRGPKDAEISHGYKEQFFDFNSVPAVERKQVAKVFVIKYIDSVFKYFPLSKALPNLIRSSESLLGNDAAKMYYSFLSNEQKSQPDSEQLSNHFKRKEKIEREIYFQDFEMKDPDGKKLKLSSINKKLILLDFWSSDCAPCRRNHPKMAALYEKFSSKGLEIISISLDTEKGDWLRAIAKDKLVWINVSDLNGWETKIAKDYFINSIPQSILLDKDRKILATRREFTLEEIEKYLK